MSEPTVDRSLNEFPEHLLVHLLSLLPTADAIRTSSLSKKWRDLWSSVSSLNFDFHTRFPPEGSTEATRRQFADFVDRSLLLRSRNSPLRKLRFSFDFREPMYQFHIDSWIRYALAHNANEIEFDFYMEPAYHTHSEFIDCSYEFSFSLLRNGSLQILRICRCVMILPLDMCTMLFESIRALYLDQILLTDEMVVDLFSGCPNLDTFSLDNCYGMKKLKICSNRLKRLLFLDFYSQNEEEEETLEISTPQLCYIRIKRIEMAIVSFKETPTLVEANVIFLQDQKHYKYWNSYIRLFKGVRRLTTQNFWFKFLASPDITRSGFVFKSLETVDLRTCFSQYDLLGMAAFLECCPVLHTMIVDYIYKIDEDEVLGEELMNKPIKFSVPCLKLLVIRNCSGAEGQIAFLRLMQTQGLALKKIVLVPPKSSEGFTTPPVVLRRAPKPTTDLDTQVSGSTTGIAYSLTINVIKEENG